MSKSKPAQPVKPRVRGALTKEQVNAEFNAAIRIPNKIREGLKELGANCCKPNDFAKLCRLSTAQLSSYQDEFSEYMVPVARNKVLWCGDTGMAAELREELS